MTRCQEANGEQVADAQLLARLFPAVVTAADAGWDSSGRGREALRAAVAGEGEDALSDRHKLDNLLHDLLPDLPRECKLMVSAARVGAGRLLRDQVARHVDPDTAVALTAAELGRAYPFDEVACRWVISEFAMAMGLELSPPGSGGATAGSPEAPPLAWPSVVAPATPDGSAEPPGAPAWPAPEPSVTSLVTVVVVDDHPFYRDGVSRGLTQSGQVRVVGEAGDGRAALEVIAAERPDVAVVDYQMPDMDGLAVLRAMDRAGLPTRVVLLSAVTDSAVVYRAFEEGAAGYLSKDARRAEIVDAVLRVAKGETVVPPGLAASMVGEIRQRAQPDPPALSAGQRQVLESMRRGMTLPQAAEALAVDPATVEIDTRRLYEKLGVHDPPAAIAEATRRGLLEVAG